MKQFKSLVLVKVVRAKLPCIENREKLGPCPSSMVRVKGRINWHHKGKIKYIKLFIHEVIS